ncbi:MraY family glycosyltransferase [Candidatus Accumulibacter sp. ACC003]|uniref:MraY family glycosyltransferase n=1 Tax=Candidatus Accumulibacter sp. ACC003 TaxID=2823334 RepID=UPI0025B85B0F|nr:MraY family glycosyltransferase [Candidatus Accumulibacter sp. ACC003]
MELAVVFSVCLVISGTAIRLAMAAASRLGIMDQPGGHKLHEVSTPFVGGIGIIAVLLSLFVLIDPLFSSFVLMPLWGLMVGALALFLTGLADDIWQLSFKLRFVVQALAALVMIFFGGVKLASFGELLPGVSFDLGLLAVPLTIFATVGLINALNMTDGIDGLSGSASLVSLALTGVVAGLAGRANYVVLIVALMGGVVGFLYYNLRYPGNARARVFLGDNGSMVLGFVLAWLFIALSQGVSPAMTPVTALWLFAMPLMDTVGVMLRRMWLGKSPFRADRHHFHHLFVRAGYRVCDIVALAAFGQLVFGLVGVGGLLLGVPQYLMFGLFLGAFATYFLVTVRPWRLVPLLRRVNQSLGLPSSEHCGIFVGHFRKQQFPELLGSIAEKLNSGHDYQISVYQTDRSTTDGCDTYCVVHFPVSGDERLIGQIHRQAVALKKHLARQKGVEVRLFMRRKCENEPRSRSLTAATNGNQRSRDRRRMYSTLIYSMERGGGPGRSDAFGFEVSLPPA